MAGFKLYTRDPEKEKCIKAFLDTNSTVEGVAGHLYDVIKERNKIVENYNSLLEKLAQILRNESEKI